MHKELPHPEGLVKNDSLEFFTIPMHPPLHSISFSNKLYLSTTLPPDTCTAGKGGGRNGTGREGDALFSASKGIRQLQGLVLYGA